VTTTLRPPQATASDATSTITVELARGILRVVEQGPRRMSPTASALLRSSLGRMPPIIPAATYRLQFSGAFTFEAATAIVDYLDALGVSHVYASSYLCAVPGSTHGYDVTDPTRLNPEIGDEPAYERWVQSLRGHDMGHIVDLVPNHMGIAQSANPWWQDVLENDPSSRYAPVFDIDWHPLKPELENKVLLPILGDGYGAVLERQEIQLEYEDGAFCARYFDSSLPVSPGTYDQVLATGSAALIEEIGAGSGAGMEFLSILSAIRHLPGRDVQDADVCAERAREKEVIKRRLAALTAASPAVLAHISRAVADLNGMPGDPRSSDRLDALLSAQANRLAYWRVAGEEINYRRFFDVNELAAIRMEDPEVFERVHAFVFDLLRRGLVDGFRIDHVDGLYDPGGCLERLQARAREAAPETYSDTRCCYVTVEKILGFDEELPKWPVEGTTGYDFLVLLNGLFVDSWSEAALNAAYERFARMGTSFRELAYRGKQLVLRVSMAGELNVLAHGLNRFSERNRHSRDFTLNSLAYAMREIIACFPVYRTYVTGREPVSTCDREFIEHAVLEARRRNPGRPGMVFEFVGRLLLKQAGHIPEDEHGEHMRFVAKFQQVTSPVTAKGIEDTALFVYNRLVSLNEVGGEPDRVGVAPEALHERLAKRAARWPHGLSATSTHDTKRSEDVRARINVLSELPGAWKQAASRWARANRKGHVALDGEWYPSRNEEYLLYQTLIGTWPFEAMTAEQEAEDRGRIIAYMQKAMREARVFTSWLNPSIAHETAMTRFVETVLAPGNDAFRSDFAALARRVAQCGIYNSLSQLAVKAGAPGVPDVYQGTEIWDFSLVDPDNRRPVDYERRRALLGALDDAVNERGQLDVARELTANPRDDRMKLYASSSLLRFRREHLNLFQRGAYQPLASGGTRREHVFAFARTHGAQSLAVVIPRLTATLLPDADTPPTGEQVWDDTIIAAPVGDAASYRHVLTGTTVCARESEGRQVFRAADVFADFPIAFLESH
jgi:(1->4)-alpha-D-glucan 1-alpha-D-glucosylmutase